MERQDNIETITLNNVEYIRKDSIPSIPVTTGDIRIVILQRGWVVVGYFSKDGEQCKVEKASVIRAWGTTKGLGEIAYSGPITNKTVLDRCPTVRCHELAIVATLDCVRDKWANHLI